MLPGLLGVALPTGTLVVSQMEKASRDNRLLKITAPIWRMHTVASHGQEAGARLLPLGPLLSCRRGGSQKYRGETSPALVLTDLGPLESSCPGGWVTGERHGVHWARVVGF